MLDYTYKAYEPGIKEKIVNMAINARGVRDTARVLGIDKNTVISTLKKRVVGQTCSFLVFIVTLLALCSCLRIYIRQYYNNRFNPLPIYL